MSTCSRFVVALCLLLGLGLSSARLATITPQIGGGIGSFDGGISVASNTFNPSCSQGTTYIAALTSPTGTEQTAFKNAICGMVADGTWGTIDALYIHANTSAANAKINAVSPGTHNLVQTGSCTFTADVGFTGDGSTCFQDTGLIPSTNGGHMTQNSAGFMHCVINSRTTQNTSVGWGAFDSGTSVGSYFLSYFNSPALNGGSINDIGGVAFNPGLSNAQGSWALTRTASNVATVYHNGQAEPTTQGAGSVSLTNRQIYELARNDVGGASSFTSDTQGYFLMGSGWTAGQVASIYSRLGIMMFNLGNTSCATPVSATNYFIDTVTPGSDANNCTSAVTACLTIAKINSLPHYGGGSISGKGGSSFTGCLVLSLSNVTNPAAGPISLLQTAGGGAAPILTSNCGGANSGSSGPKTAAITLDSVDAITNGWVIRGSGLVAGSATQYGIAAQNSAGTRTVTVLIENTDISGFGVVGLTGSSDQGADIFMGGFSEAAGFPTACGNMNISLLNNTLHGSTTTSGENNGFYGTGCGVGQTQQVQGNLIFNISGINNNPGTGNGGYLGQGNTGLSGGANSYIQFTLAHDIGSNGTTCGGPVGLWAYQTYLALLQFDEVYNVQGSGGLPGGACDFSAFDFDIAANYGLAQYLYAHNTGGPGFVIYDGGRADVVRYSILENTGSYNEDGGGAFSVGSGSPGPNWSGYNNTIFQNYVPGTSTPPTCLSLGFNGAYASGFWANNACRNEVVDTFNRTNMLNGNSATGVTNITMANNDYFTSAGGVLTFAINWPNPTNYATLATFQAGTSQEANSKTIDPGFSAPPTGTCTWTPSSQSPTWPPTGCPSAYSTLAAGLKSAGANLAGSFASPWFVAPLPTTEGTRDYYGDPITGGGCRNMGAYGVCP